MSMVWIAAVLRAWGDPMPANTARVAVIMCRNAAGADMPQGVDHDWGHDVRSMRARGDLVETGTGDAAAWVLGPGAADIYSAGWPDQHAARAVAALRRHGVEAVLAGGAHA